MRSALGMLRWAPDTFWNATMYEYTAAIDGLMTSKGARPMPEMTRNDLLNLIAEDERTKKAE